MPDFALAISKLSRREVLSVLDFLSPNLTAEIVHACHRLRVRRAISEELTSQDHRALLHDVHYVQLVEDMDAA
jgi:hypothetical protein